VAQIKRHDFTFLLVTNERIYRICMIFGTYKLHKTTHEYGVSHDYLLTMVLSQLYNFMLTLVRQRALQS